MIDILEDTSILIVSNPRGKILPFENISQLLPADISPRIEPHKKGKAGEKLIYPVNWIMPPEPEAYIKYPRYDFL